MGEFDALEGRVTRLESQITAGFARIEGLLRAEINDLKTEQITDLRDANKRLADDQRRLWEAVTQTGKPREEIISNANDALHHIALI